MVALAVLVVAASVYLVYVLEILKFRRLDALRLRRLRPEASPAEIESGVALDLETGEYDVVVAERSTVRVEEDRSGTATLGGRPAVGMDGVVSDVSGGAQQRIGERQMDQDGVGTEDKRGDAQAAAIGEGGQRQRPYRIPRQ